MSYKPIDIYAYDKEGEMSVSLSSNKHLAVRKHEEVKTAKPSFFSLYKFAKRREKLLITIGVFASLLQGAAYPIQMALYGEITTLFFARLNGENFFPKIIPLFGGGKDVINGTSEEIASSIRQDADAFGLAVLAVAALDALGSIVGVFCFNFAATQQISRIRRLFFKSLISKDMAWFDKTKDYNFTYNVTEGLSNWQEGIGEKISFFIAKIASFLISIALAGLYGWKLTFIITACIPMILIASFVVNNFETDFAISEQMAYKSATSIAEEVFTSIKTVFAFGGEEFDFNRFNNKLAKSEKAAIIRNGLSAFIVALTWFFIFSIYALGFWYGVQLLLESKAKGDFIYTPLVIPIVVFVVVAGGVGMTLCFAYAEKITLARGSAAILFKTLGTLSKQDPFSTEGKTLDTVRGDIEFHSVDFHYPNRIEVPILRKFNLKVESGENIALIGSSGSGKSTVIQLIQRLYAPVKGQVTLDGINISTLNLSFYRQLFGVVSQEPQLFAASIAENIRLGKPEATMEEMYEAAKIANAHSFIEELPEGYATMIGERGTMLSGGQKQRIAIARAIIRNPLILLLDEATSALDNANEKEVQKALDNASQGRTTITVAHRLSTIQHCDEIIVMKEGEMVEKGTHRELVALNGDYCKLLRLQNLEKKTEEGNKRSDIGQSEASNRSTNVSEREDDCSIIEGALPTLRPKKGSLWGILQYSKPEWMNFAIGGVATLVVGAVTPASAYVLGEIYGGMAEKTPARIQSTVDKYAWQMFILAVCLGIALFIQIWCFGFISIKLTTRLRALTFKSILKQEPGWFDREENRVGALSSKLSGNINDLQGISGNSLSVIVQAVVTLSLAVCLSFYYSYKLTLVTLLALPTTLFGVYYELYTAEKQIVKEKKALELATKGAVEALSCIRTVAGLGREEYFVDKFDKELKAGESGLRKKSLIRGIVYCLGQNSSYIGYLASLWFGGYLVASNQIDFKNVIKISEALLFGTWVLGQSLAFSPNFGKARLSAAKIFSILDRESLLKDGNFTPEKRSEHRRQIEFQNLSFSYPTRPNIEVLKSFDLDIEAGSKIAFVGTSGCGKSTVIQLILRFYDVKSGAVRLDHENIRRLSLSYLRAQMSLVQQEPILFAMTIGENIAYGDNSRAVPLDEIIKAAIAANIHDFIASLPLGYNTVLGMGGTQLSGGQKQRIAIARALIRNPRILLLDEATSALDAESEAVVQTTLDRAVTGRTTITIGHRMRAVAAADLICVLQKGKIVEKGKHSELMALNGLYAEINAHQMTQESRPKEV